MALILPIQPGVQMQESQPKADNILEDLMEAVGRDERTLAQNQAKLFVLLGRRDAVERAREQLSILEKVHFSRLKRIDALLQVHKAVSGDLHGKPVHSQLQRFSCIRPAHAAAMLASAPPLALSSRIPDPPSDPLLPWHIPPSGPGGLPIWITEESNRGRGGTAALYSMADAALAREAAGDPGFFVSWQADPGEDSEPKVDSSNLRPFRPLPTPPRGQAALRPARPRPTRERARESPCYA